MKYDSGMTYLNKDILAAVRLMCGNNGEITEKFSPNDGSPAPLRDYLKKRYGNNGKGSSKIKYFCSPSKGMEIWLDKSIPNSDNDKKLLLSWSQVAKFIRDNWKDVFRKESPENQPSPAAEKSAEADKPKPTYKDVLLEHYPDFDESRFDKFTDKNCVGDFFDDGRELECLYFPNSPDEDCKKCWERKCKYKWKITEGEEKNIEPYINAPTKEPVANDNTDTEVTDLPNPPVSAKENTALFDYSELDGDTAQRLKNYANAILKETAGYATFLGKTFKEAQDLLANHSDGTFEKWYKSVGFKRQTVYNLIHRYEFFDSPMLAGREEAFEALPLTAAYEISSPKASEELINKTLDSNIKESSEYRKLKKELEETLERSKAAQDEYESLYSRHYEDLTKWCAETSELKQRINELENRPLEAEITKATSQISLLQSTIDEKNGELDGTRAVIETLEKEKETLEKEIDELQSRPVEVAVQQDESVMEELEQLREENKRLKDKNIKNMIIRITLDDFEQLLELTKSNERIYAAVSKANIIKL